MSLSTQAARDFKGTHTEGRTPEELRELVSHVGAELELAPAENIIEWAVATFGDRFCVTSSMGDAVLAHLAAKVAPGLDVVFLDTGYHFVETIGTRDAVEATLPVNLITITPVQSVAEQDATYGKDLYKTDPDLCCKLRKVQPLADSLAGYDAWATGLRRAETHNRVIAPVVGLGRPQGQGQGLAARAVERRADRRPTSPTTACSSIPSSTTTTRASGAGRAHDASPPATTRAAVAGQAPPRPSAGSTDDFPRPQRQRRRSAHHHPRWEAHLMAAPALVALAHGSRDPRSAATIKALVAEVKAMRPDLRVETAFLDLSKPSFDTVVDRLVKAGFDEIVVVPLLLTEAFHAKVDVPAAVAAATARHKDLKIRASRVLGMEAAFLEVLDVRLREALKDARVRELDALVLAAAGSSDPLANQAVARLARTWGTRHKLPVTAAFASAAPPAAGEAVRVVPGRGSSPHRGRLVLPRARASWATVPPSSPSRPARLRSPRRSAHTPRSRGSSWPATPSVPWSSCRSEPGGGATTTPA